MPYPEMILRSVAKVDGFAAVASATMLSWFARSALDGILGDFFGAFLGDLLFLGFLLFCVGLDFFIRFGARAGCRFDSNTLWSFLDAGF